MNGSSNGFRFEPRFFWWHLLKKLQQCLIILVALFTTEETPVLQFSLMFLPLACYALAVFACRPFQSDEDDALECITQTLLLLLCLGGLIRYDNDGLHKLHKGLGEAVVYLTLFLSAAVVAWAVVKDLSYSIGSQQVLAGLNAKSGSNLPLLSRFDKACALASACARTCTSVRALPTFCLVYCTFRMCDRGSILRFSFTSQRTPPRQTCRIICGFEVP